MLEYKIKQTNLAVTLLMGILLLSGCTAQQTQDNGQTETLGSEGIIEQETFEEIGEEFTLPILGYHHVGPAPSYLSASAKQWYVSKEAFISMLDYIRENNFTPITASEASALIPQGLLPEKPIMITIDDGAIDMYTEIFPIINERKIPVTLFMMTGVRGPNYVNADQLKEMHKSGVVDVQSHTKFHAYLTRVGEAERKQELQESKDYLEELLNKQVTVLAYPFGLYNDTVIEDIQNIGYDMALTINPGNTQQQDKLFEMKRTLVVEHTDIEKVVEN